MRLYQNGIVVSTRGSKDYFISTVLAYMGTLAYNLVVGIFSEIVGA